MPIMGLQISIHIKKLNPIDTYYRIAGNKIFTDGSKNEDLRIKFSQMLDYRAELEHNYA